MSLAQKLEPHKRSVSDAAVHRARLGNAIGVQLERAALDDAYTIADADEIKEAARPENIWYAENLRNADDEFFDGYDSFSSPSNRLDPGYMARSSRQARKNIEKCMARIQPQAGELKMFVTLTMPTLIGFGFARTLDFFDDASTRFRQSKYFNDNVRGGTRAEEFTLGDKRCAEHRRLKTSPKSKICKNCELCRAFVWSFKSNGYHFHAHYLLWSKWLKWDELGAAWTRSLKASAKKFGVELNFNTSHGRAVVHVRHVTADGTGRDTITNADAIAEACKYITKGSDFEKLPDSELKEINCVLRGRRMIESLGEANTRKGSTSAEKDVVREVHNLDTQHTVESLPCPKRTLYRRNKRAIRSLREVGADMISAGRRAEWLELLETKYSERREYRKVQLAKRYPLATFHTLDGKVWSWESIRPAEKAAASSRVLLNPLAEKAAAWAAEAPSYMPAFLDWN